MTRWTVWDDALRAVVARPEMLDEIDAEYLAEARVPIVGRWMRRAVIRRFRKALEKVASERPDPE